MVIPDTYLGLPVISIDNSAFEDRESLMSVTIPSSVISIGNYAFSGCSHLTIYCEATSEPDGWAYNWNYSKCPVVWDYTGEQLLLKSNFCFVYHL